MGSNPVFVLKQDLKGNGKSDLIVVNQDSDNISILLGNGDGTFKPQKIYSAGTMPNAAVTGDFNRDGKIDIEVASNSGVSVLLGNGDGTFRPETTYTATGPMTGIAQAALRQDGIAGTHQIQADYGGNTTFNPNHSSTLTIEVVP